MSDGYDSEIKSLKQRVADLEERLTKKDWIVELPGLNGELPSTYLISDLFMAIRASIRDLESATARPHTRLEKIEKSMHKLMAAGWLQEDAEDAAKEAVDEKMDWIS